MERISKRLYMREHSNVIRKFQSVKLLDKMEENPIFNIEGTNRIILVTICRIRQRMLTAAWRILVRNTGVKHDYELDAKVILSRKLPDEELRTELEIEILYNWIYATKDIDPTGIANTIFLCKKRSAVYNALQQLRMEFYEPGETVLFQGDIPRPEDGHFTIFNGVCEVLQFPEDSMPLMKMLYLAKKKKWDDARKLLNQAIVLARITKGSGFGELSTLTGVKRAATIRTDPNATSAVEIVVLPKQALLDCLKSRRQDGVEGAAPSEAMDFMRQSGLANRISPKDLVRVAQSMVRRTLLQGEILFYKGETVKSLFLVVSGELLLDTGDFMVDGQPQAFINSNPDNCYHMSSGSILGDEGVTGQSNRFESTAVVVSDAAVVFEAVDFGMTFLTEKIGALRYCALAYRDNSRWSAPIHLAEEINPYTYFHSLRKAIAYTHPYRGSRPRIYADDNAESNVKIGGAVAGSPGSAKLRRGVGRPQAHPPQKMESNVKKLSPLVRMDSNLAYMMTVEQTTNPNRVIEFDYPRQLKPVGLHHALEINRTAKKLAQKFVKVHAQENILYDQMTKNIMQATPGREQQEAEARFKSYIAEYRERAAKHAAQVQREMERERLAKAQSNVVKFYGSLSPDNSVKDGSSIGSIGSRSVRRGLDEDELEDVVQSKPFSGMLQRSSANIHKTPTKGKDSEKADAQAVSGVHTPVSGTATPNVDRFRHNRHGSADAHMRITDSGGNTLNVVDIEKAVHDALMKSDFEQFNTENTATNEKLESYEDAVFFQRPKIVQYFIWMDHLNRHTYRALLHQSQQTVDQNMARPHAHEKLTLTDKTMEELTQIFNRFGLTPTDMNIPWRPGSPKTGLARFDDYSDEDEPPPAPGSPAQPTASTAPVVPALELPKAAHEENKNAVGEREWGRADEEKERNLALIKVQGKFQTYHPSSWRHEIIMKKEKGIIKENFHLFLRSTTPDNRRICIRYYHYPGQHHPDFAAKDGAGGAHDGARPASRTASRPVSRPGSRPHTGHHSRRNAVEDTETASMVEKREALEEKLEDLRTNFAAVPEKFIEAVKTIDMPKRREHLPNNEWRTRFLRCAVEVPPGDSATAAKIERKRKAQVTRTIPSDSYSKETLLQSAKAALDENKRKYVLTDSNKILEESLNSGMLNNMQNSKSVRLLRSSFLSQSGGRLMSSGNVLPVPLKDVGRSDSAASLDEPSTPSRSRRSSLSRLSYDEADLAFQAGVDVPLSGRSPKQGHDGKSGGEAEGDTDGERAHGDDDHSDADHSGPAGNRARHDSSVFNDREDQSVAESAVLAALSHSHLSPIAPEPSHIDLSATSEQSAEAQLRALSPSKDTAAAPPAVSPLTLLSPAAVAGAQPTGTGTGTGTESDVPTPHAHASSSTSTKAADVAAQRIKELKEKIVAHAPSDALELFNNYMKTDNNPRKFYEGKKKASASSKYGLVSALKGIQDDPNKPSAAEVELLGLKKGTVSRDLALFNSLFPDATEEQRQQFIENNRKARLAEAMGGSLHGGGSVTPGANASQSLADSNTRMSVKDLRLEPVQQLTPEASRSRAASRTLQEMERDAQLSRLLIDADGAEQDLDPDVVVWQQFTVDTMHKEKTGPKKILPVLIMKNEAGASSRRFAVNKSKRWGSGVLLQLAAKAEEEPIAGPPTYLEIFKGTQRRKLREKDRQRITDELHALIK